LTENEKADIERRLRIRMRNLERLEQEAGEVEESEAPPAVLGRLQAQIRVEKEEIRLLETQVQEAEQRRSGAMGSSGAGSRLGPVPKLLVRIVLALVATGVLLVVVQAALRILPHVPEAATSTGVPPTHTLSPTYTPAPATITSAVADTEVVTTTDTITVAAVLTATGPLTATEPQTATLAATPADAVTAAVPQPTMVSASRELTGTFATVHEDPLNLRSGPGTTYRVLRQLANGDKLQVTGRTAASDWLAVATADGEAGWVKTDYLTVTVSVGTIPVKEVTGSGG
jgi:uncharacterized protein YraI